MKRRAARAFTLIEILVVIIIIAVLSSIVVPNYARFYEQTQYREAVHRTVDLIAWARDAAIRAGVNSVVAFDPQTETFFAQVEPTADDDLPTELQEAREEIPMPEPRVFTLPEEITVQDFQGYGASGSGVVGATGNQARAMFHFREDGSCEGGRFVLLSQKGYRTAIEVLPLTGRVVMEDEE